MKKLSKKKTLISSIVILFLIIATVSIITVINSHKEETITTNIQANNEIKSTTNNITTNSTTISDTSDYTTTIINPTTTTKDLNITKSEKNTQHSTATTKVQTTEQTIAKQYNVGDTIFFGNIFGQNIAWEILKIEDDSALIISKNIIANKSYHINRDDVNWEESAIRAWLNQTFYDNAFSNKEKLHIFSDFIYTTDYFNDSEGFYTTDKIFLLSLEEVNEYFSNENSKSTGDWWMLRTTGSDLGSGQMYGPVSIDSNGYTMLPEPIYLDEPSGIRPAMNIILPLD